MRVVLDTNVLVSAFVFPGGPPEAVYRLAIEGRIQLVTSRPLLAELGRVLTDKFGWDTERAEEAVSQVARLGLVVDPREKIRVVHADPSDDRVLEAAVAADAGVIVSGDRHLRELREWRGVRIQNASTLLAELSSS